MNFKVFPFLHPRHNTSPCDPERGDQPEERTSVDWFKTNEDMKIKVRSQKKITVLFGNFSQVADPPSPSPPFGNPLFEKKIYRLFCILGP